MVGYDNILKDGGKQDFKTIKYINSHEQNINSIKSTTTYLGNYLIASAVNPDGDRKVILQALSDIITVAGGYNYFTNIYARGQKKSWLTGSWRDYNTSIYIYGNDPGSDVEVSTPYWGVQTFYVGTYQTSSDAKSLTVQLFNQIKIMSGYGDPIWFTKVNLRAHTGGTTPATYAEINEQ